jgi:hypothetical protein
MLAALLLGGWIKAAYYGDNDAWGHIAINAFSTGVGVYFLTLKSKKND